MIGKSLLCFVLAAGFATAVFSQATLETGKAFMRQQDYANAGLVFTRVLQTDPQNIEATKNLALSHFYRGDNDKAQEVILPLLDKDAADDQSFQIAGYIYKQAADFKAGEKLYRKGLKKFPQSGALYNDFGELQYGAKQYDDAIKNWEKGIETDPSYSRNYFNAARHYYLSQDRVLSTVYAEIFLNMEPVGTKTAEAKQILLDSYKKLFASVSLMKDAPARGFGNNYLRIMNSQTDLAAGGITTDALAMIRTRFLLQWFADKSIQTPTKLFAYQNDLLREGLFEAYNQWLFGVIENPRAYQNWVTAHPTEQKDFSDFQRSRVFKMPAGETYK